MRAQQRGLTLPELLVAMSVVAILLGVAVPGFATMFTRLRVQGAGAEFGTDLYYARSEALRQRTAVTLSTTAGGDGYTIAAGGVTLKSVTLPAGVSMSESTAVSFDAMRALADPADQTFVLESDDSLQLRVSSNVMGRVQLCVQAGSIPGYDAC